MSSYLFVLGRDRDLSLAELRAVYPKADFRSSGQEFAVLDLNQAFGQADLDRLGGVVKVAKVIGSVNVKGLEDVVFEEIEKQYSGSKFNYAASVYNCPIRQLRTLLIGLKKRLKKAGMSTRFANQNFQNLSVAQHKGLKGGAEFVVAKDMKGFFVGQVVAVQDIDAYSKRDFKKPFRDMQMGMLPPKLAQILINLTGSPARHGTVVDGVIWDPFCGSGTVVMEGVLMGRDMLGSDIEKKRVEGARQNIDWLQKHFKVSGKAELFAHDATQPFSGHRFDAVAAEVDLGLPHGRHLSEPVVRDQMKGLHQLYVGFFEALKAIGFKGPVVVALPFFRPLKGPEIEMTETLHAIKTLGFEPSALLPKGIGAERFKLKYARPDQAVGRAIFRFEAA